MRTSSKAKRASASFSNLGAAISAAVTAATAKPETAATAKPSHGDVKAARDAFAVAARALCAMPFAAANKPAAPSPAAGRKHDLSDAEYINCATVAPSSVSLRDESYILAAFYAADEKLALAPRDIAADAGAFKRASDHGFCNFTHITARGASAASAIANKLRDKFGAEFDATLAAYQAALVTLRDTAKRAA